MRRRDLEHLIRAAAAITNVYEFIIIGSQSILGALESPPDELTQSTEADLYPLNNDERLSDLIDGALGEGSLFHENFGYYAQGVGPETAILPNNWQSRLIKVQNKNTDLKVGYCLDPHDLAIAKLLAWREKDVDFLKVMFSHDIIQMDKVIALAKETPLKTISEDELLRRIDSVFRENNDHSPR